LASGFVEGNQPIVPAIVAASETPADFSDPAAEAEIGWVVDLVTAIRSVRAEMNITPATLMPLIMIRGRQEARSRVERWSDAIKRLARIGDISFENLAPVGAIQLLVRDEVAALPLKGVVDLSAEKARLEKEIAKAEGDIKRVETKLSNEKFVANAPEEIVEEEKEKHEAAVARREKNAASLRWLESAMQQN
jgi:valyl-tRNA synthetase